MSAGNTRHEPSDPFWAHGPLAAVVVVVDAVLLVDVLDELVVLVEVLVVDGLVEVAAGGLVVLVVVVGVAVPGSGAAQAPTQRAAAVTDATNNEPRPMAPYRQMPSRP